MSNEINRFLNLPGPIKKISWKSLTNKNFTAINVILFKADLVVCDGAPDVTGLHGQLKLRYHHQI